MAPTLGTIVLATCSKPKHRSPNAYPSDLSPDVETQVGLPGTLLVGVRPDPANSLRALIDRDPRNRVIAANRGDALLACLFTASEDAPG